MNPFVRLWSRKRILRKGRLTGCMVLIALVMAPVVAALIFSESMINGITEKFIFIADGHVQVNGASYVDIDEDKVLFRDETITGYALMYSSTETASLAVKGVPDSYFNTDRTSQMFLTLDEEKTNLNSVIISESTAKDLKVGLGDKVAMMVVPDTDGAVLRPVMLRVGGIYSTGYNAIDSSLAFVSFDYARKLFTSPESVTTEIVVTSEWGSRLNEVLNSIRTDGTLSSWETKNASVYNNFLVSIQAIRLVLLIIVFVASFYTASVANQIVEDDTKEIALSKLIGAPDSMVRRSAFISIFTVTIAGIIIGLGLGVLVGTHLSPVLSKIALKGYISLDYYLVSFDAIIPWGSITLVILVKIAVSAIAISMSLRHTRKITPMRLFTGV